MKYPNEFLYGSTAAQTGVSPDVIAGIAQSHPNWLQLTAEQQVAFVLYTQAVMREVVIIEVPYVPDPMTIVGYTPRSAVASRQISRDDDFQKSTHKFDPYETLIGTTRDQPSVILLSTFEPLYKRVTSNVSDLDDASILTPGGINCALRMKSIMSKKTAIAILKKRLNLIPRTKALMTAREEAFMKMFTETKNDVYNVSGILSSLDSLKKMLDIRDHTHSNNAKGVYTSMQKLVGSSTLSRDFADEFIDANLSVDVSLIHFLRRLGWDESGVINRFSSSKLWMQAAIELRNLLEGHSDSLLDRSRRFTTTSYDEFSLVTEQQEIFDITRVSATDSVARQVTKMVPSLNELTSDSVINVDRSVNRIASSFNTLYSSAAASDKKIKIAAALHILTRELRVSSALASPQLRQLLSTKLGYNLYGRTTYPDVFRSVLGEFGKNVFDVPVNMQRSLIGAAFLVDEATPTQVMTFENKYITTANGTITPGSRYYVDAALDVKDDSYNVENMLSLVSKMNVHASTFASLLSSLNVMMDAASTGDTTTSTRNMLSNPRHLLTTIRDVFLNSGDSSSPFPVKSEFLQDVTSSLWSLAVTDPRLKAMLFMLVMSRVVHPFSVGVYDDPAQAFNTKPTANVNEERIITQLVARVQSIFKKKSVSAFKLTSTMSKVSESLIRDVFVRNRSFTLKTVIQLMHMIWTAFSHNSEALGPVVSEGQVSVRRTRYTGWLDTTVMMVAFDIIVDLISEITHKKLKSVATDKTGVKYIIENMQYTTIMREADAQKFASIATRLDVERSLVSEGVLAFVTVMRNIGNRATQTHSLLSSKNAASNLKNIRTKVGDDLLRDALQEQQVAISRAVISDVSDTLASTSSVRDVTSNRAESNEDVLRILDDGSFSRELWEKLRRFCYQSELINPVGSNVKILSVGVPQGFSDHLVENVTLNMGSYSADRQKDVISLRVHKVDNMYPHLIFKPLTYMFEMSKFPVRSPSRHIDIRSTSVLSLHDLVASVPLRDTVSAINTTQDVLEFMSSSVLERYKSDPAVRSVSKKVAFEGSEYSFLSAAQKLSVYKNHVVSYFLELYLRLMTGLNVSETKFHIEQNNLRFTKDVAVSLIAGLENMNASQIVAHASSIDSLGRAFSTLSDPDQTSSAILKPKMFDRVFNIMFDPDLFEIDVNKTRQSKVGTEVLGSLIRSGMVKSEHPARYSKSMFNDTFETTQLRTTFVQKDQSSGDVSFDKYFVTIEPSRRDVT